MDNPTKDQIFAFVRDDLEAKIAAKSPEPIQVSDYEAMVKGSMTKQSGRIKDLLGFMGENNLSVPSDSRGTFKEIVVQVLLSHFQAIADAVYVSQYVDDFDTKFGAFCSTVLEHLNALAEKQGELGAALIARFEEEVGGTSLNMKQLTKVVAIVQRELTDHYMSDQRGEVTKAFQPLARATELGLLSQVSFVGYRTAEPTAAAFRL